MIEDIRIVVTCNSEPISQFVHSHLETGQLPRPIKGRGLWLIRKVLTSYLKICSFAISDLIYTRYSVPVVTSPDDWQRLFLCSGRSMSARRSYQCSSILKLGYLSPDTYLRPSSKRFMAPTRSSLERYPQTSQIYSCISRCRFSLWILPHFGHLWDV